MSNPENQRDAHAEINYVAGLLNDAIGALNNAARATAPGAALDHFTILRLKRAPEGATHWVRFPDGKVEFYRLTAAVERWVEWTPKTPTGCWERDPTGLGVPYNLYVMGDELEEAGHEG